MPYIEAKTRNILDHPLHELGAVVPGFSIGVLNYVVVKLCLKWLKNRSRDYETLNAIVGMLECVKLELFRRVVAPYEDGRCGENGDVF
jgi:hypothetical protein